MRFCLNELNQKCTEIRKDIIEMIAGAASGHPGGSLSIVEIMVALYHTQMRIDSKNPNDPNRDRFVLSKGHAAPCYYAVLGDMGYFDKKEFASFRQLNSILQGHPDAKKTPGVDASTGSLGQGVSIATGMALGAKAQKKDIHVYALLGDGELQEGQVWEASMATAHYKLDNLTLIIDHNGLQIDGANEQVMALGSIVDKFQSFGFHTIEVQNGNDLEEIIAALDADKPSDKPRCIIARTVKGKGVSFMENQVGWHGKAPSEEEKHLALKELEGQI